MSKIEYKGQKTLLDPDTGEVINMDIVSKSYDKLDRKGWRRVIMTDLMESIEQIGNKKIKVLEFLIDNMDGKNQINLTYRQIHEKTSISIDTITKTFTSLKECGLIKKYGGVYVLNTTIVSSYGNKENNKYLTIEYNFTGDSIKKEEKEEDKVTEKERELMKEIEKLKKLIPNVA